MELVDYGEDDQNLVVRRQGPEPRVPPASGLSHETEGGRTKRDSGPSATPSAARSATTRARCIRSRLVRLR